MNSIAGWKRVFIAEHPLQAATMATALEAEGLTPQLRGMELWGVAVEILFSEGAAPSVWVPAAEEQQALAVVQRMRKPAADKRWDWTCPGCGERVPGSFETCWQCGEESPYCSEPEAAAGDEGGCGAGDGQGGGQGGGPAGRRDAG